MTPQLKALGIGLSLCFGTVSALIIMVIESVQSAWDVVDRYGVSITILFVLVIAIWGFAKWLAKTVWPFIVSQIESGQVRIDAQYKAFMEAEAKRDTLMVEYHHEQVEAMRAMSEANKAVVEEMRGLKDTILKTDIRRR